MPDHETHAPLQAPLQAHEVILAAHEGERTVMLALVHGAARLARTAAVSVARCFAITPQSHLLR